MIGEKDLRLYLDRWDKKYWATYKVLDVLQKVQISVLLRHCLSDGVDKCFLGCILEYNPMNIDCMRSEWNVLLHVWSHSVLVVVPCRKA